MPDSRLPLYKGKNIHVLGAAGTEGSSVIDFLVSRGLTTITAHEMLARDAFGEEFDHTHQWLEAGPRQEAARRLLAHPIAFQWRDTYLRGVDRADVVFVPQSWFRYPENTPLHALRQRGVPFSSMTHLFFEECPCPIVGVTGTNGKFTVAYLIHQMLLHSGRNAFFSGNDRSHVPILYDLDRIRPADWLVLEVSNRQLIDLPYSPRIAVITNIAAHHLDDHGTMDNYVNVKANLIRHQREGDPAVLNADNPHTSALAAQARDPYLFSASRRLPRGAFVDEGRVVIDHDGIEQTLPLSVLRLTARHAIENALAASLAAALAGASVPAIADVLADFTGLPYRFRLVDERGGVRYYEDSLATNPAAAAAAIKSMDRPFVLIAGGARPKATVEEFAPLQAALKSSPVRSVLLIGATAPLLKQALAGLSVEVVEVGTLDRAVAEASRRARGGEAVLLSPACESFDQFRDYRQRGDRFVELVRKELRAT